MATGTKVESFFEPVPVTEMSEDADTDSKTGHAEGDHRTSSTGRCSVSHCSEERSITAENACENEQPAKYARKDVPTLFNENDNTWFFVHE